MDRLDVAIVGCGFVANDHLKAWRKVPIAQVRAVCDVNESLAEKTAKVWRIPKYYSSLSNLLDHEKSCVIDICTPPHTHAPIAVEAMKSNHNILLEKPMTMTARDAEEIVRCQKTTGVKAGVIHNWLFEPPVPQASHFVSKGGIGEVFNVEVEALRPSYDAMASNENHWCHKFPGGRFSEMLAHPIYLIRNFLGGEVELRDVHVAKIGDYPWMKSDELVATFRSGKKLGRAYASFNSSRDDIFISLYGREGILKLDVVNATLNFLHGRKTKRFTKATDSLRQANQLIMDTVKNAARITFRRWLSGHDLYIKIFANNMLLDREPPVTVQEGYSVVKVVEETCERIAAAERDIRDVETGSLLN